MKKISKEQILKFLHANPIMALAAVNDNKPLSSILVFDIDDDFTFYFVTRSETYKAKALAKNSAVGLSIWEHKELLVQVDGKAEAITNEQETEEVISRISKKVTEIKDFWPPLLQLHDKGTYMAFRVKPSWLRVLDLADESITKRSPAFTEIPMK